MKDKRKPAEWDLIIGVKASDPEMVAAIRQARDTFPQFAKEVRDDYRRVIPVLDAIMVKAAFVDSADSNKVEHMWVNQIKISGDKITGTLTSHPQHLKSLKNGDRVTFDLSALTDWLYVESRKAHGAFTVRLLRSRMTDAERKEHDSHYPFSFD